MAAKNQLELVIGCASDALKNNGMVVYGCEDGDAASDKDIETLIHIDDLWPGLCSQSILGQGVWAIVLDAFTVSDEAHKGIVSLDVVLDKAFQIMKCALVGNIKALHTLHCDLHWSSTQLEALAKSSVSEFWRFVR